jgi:hypothetical protein
MKSTFILLKDIQTELQKAFVNYSLDDSKEVGKLRPPHVWIGHAPPKKSMPAYVQKTDNKMPSGDPPFIVVRFLEDENREDKGKALIAEATIGILCCVYSRDSYEEIEVAYHDILNMTDRVILTIINRGMYWGDNHWWREGAVKRLVGLQKELGQIYEAGMQDHPYYGAAVIATFKTPAIPRPPITNITR